MNNSEDLTGKRFGIVNVIGLNSVKIQPNGRRRYYWNLRCDCGREFTSRTDAVKRLESCGCKRNKDNAIRMTIHSDSRNRLYKIYYSMKGRCTNPSLKEYMRYGGRGIEICKEWDESYENFKEWAYANGFNTENPELSLERIDVNGNYEPSNCKWIKLKEQYNNMQRTIRIADLSLSEFCRQAGLKYSSVKSKYYRTKDIVYALGFKEKH